MSNFQDLPPPVHLRSKLFHPLDFGCPVLNEAPPTPIPLPNPPQKTMEQQPHRACERRKLTEKQNQVTSHSNWPGVLLFDIANKQCNDIIKEWLHCLTPESIRRFLIINVLMFDSAWCLVMVQLSKYLFATKIKLGRKKIVEQIYTSLPTLITKVFVFTSIIYYKTLRL